MKKQLFFITFCLILFSFNTVFAQKPNKIEVINADHSDINQVELPDAVLLTGNVQVKHDGAILTCNKAYYFQKENYLKAFGNVHIIQGDTLTMSSKYAEYNGENKQAFATGNVILQSPEMSMVTDTLNFDRNSQEAYYTTGATITNKGNTLNSKSGKYYVNQKKYQFLTAVVITTPDNVIKSNHLDYYTNSGHSYLLGPSTIIGKENKIYTENGFYDTKKDVARLERNSNIRYNNLLIKADSLFYNKKTGFARGVNNVKITDSINKIIIKGHYAEIYKFKDSMFVTKRALAVSIVENDSVFMHAKKLMVTGKEGNRIIRGFKNARFYKTDLSGKCDSIHSDQKKALTQLIGKPILWNFDNQMTGDVIHLIGNNQTQNLDSLKVLNNAFIVSKDTVGTGFNQVKGQNLYGKFKDKSLQEVDIVKNTEVIYYMRNDQQELIGINKSISSKINLMLDKNKVDTLTLFGNPDGDIFPEKDLPENARKLRGFIWRGDERIITKYDIFPAEENELNDKIVKESAAKNAKEDVPMKVLKETLDYDKNNPKTKIPGKIE
ncbi:OstA-like protein [Flavobacterium sp. GT3R68]|uniref:OstA-like protein n=1 Tax=Flavobacterium sp. GT3R68 TaxID=2594437 RepID=UPI000F874D0A|nr:OstA-like protein [Flavobacterium sp. GT3R68]RTY92368.1 OstA-like protein [Flavobacterium sp. GSN2]TRW92282.1 OstA-like protein [Flavobacterium sp. GT3R68]